MNAFYSKFAWSDDFMWFRLGTRLESRGWDFEKNTKKNLLNRTANAAEVFFYVFFEAFV